MSNNKSKGRYHDEQDYSNLRSNKWSKTNDYDSGNSSFSYNNYEKKVDPKIIHINKEDDITLSSPNGVPARVRFFPNYLNKTEADDLFAYLTENLNWQQREGVSKSGEKYNEPRMTFWLGKPYKYSAIQWDENKVWDKKLEELRDRLSEQFTPNERKLNSVMCNYYRNNKDSIGWHADDETSLGRNPFIASLSFGEERIFEVCKRNEYYSRSYYNGPQNTVFNGCSILYKFHLNHGSLLTMEGSVQEEWLHRVPREFEKLSGRINLTYRYIVDEEEENAEIERKKILRQKSKKNFNQDVKVEIEPYPTQKDMEVVPENSFNFDNKKPHQKNRNEKTVVKNDNERHDKNDSGRRNNDKNDNGPHNKDKKDYGRQNKDKNDNGRYNKDKNDNGRYNKEKSDNGKYNKDKNDNGRYNTDKNDFGKLNNDKKDNENDKKDAVSFNNAKYDEDFPALK